ncbi:hypothetical protein MVLG_05919 [Microbotryum lychnidis-dioicae p1A1 Lamole]|uniref:Uncharacterized protein n=1 Tax=Microbotryum lychnidis-dioicae (strain p1A1 Lamole / MvSl-1064) TaxID=683840 RepID=U5HFP3_USTV1|nr:hypothetical protein MVLG_05919 [Microbotryum lychnidis-dioicae p1A1 Lamole]|eukprot:KDE03584.1 hypothetical protein MVLG_05919 [Microbotryum lychnidis-dioicae p1A1 Lamole]
MSGAARLGLADIAHRTLVTGLAGLSVYGLYGMYRIHTDTMQAGEEAWKKHLDDEAKVKSESAFVAETGSHSSAPPTTTSEIPRHRF